MSDFRSPDSKNPFSDSDSSNNPFVGPSVAVIRDVPIQERVPVKLSHTAANFFPWKTYFGLLFREYDLLDHVDGTIDLLAMPHDPDWLAIDATIIRWFYQTVSPEIFRTVVREGDSAHTVWSKITGLFTDNKIQRVTFLQQEFFGTHQEGHSLDDYVLKLKTLSDELRDLEFPIDDKIMLSTLSAGLGEDLSNAASNLTLLTTPSFEQAVAYLRLEERRLKHLRARAAHTALVAGVSKGGSAPAHPAPVAAPRPPGPPPGFYSPPPLAPIPPPGGNGNAGGGNGGGGNGGGGRRGRRRRGGGNGGGNSNASAPQPRQTAPIPPWIAGHNPWTGFVSAYSMPVPRAPYPGTSMPRPAPHQALYAAAPQPAAYGYAAPGYTAPYASQWDPALLTALQSVPSAGAYGGGGDWFMDTGASAHMAAHPGNLSTSSPASTPSRIIVGNGHALPITHTGSAPFPSTSTPLSLNNVLISPDLIHNLVSVRSLTRDNHVSVEFDEFGFSVKDGRTRMLLHRSDSPGELYPVSPSSTASRPLALSAAVDLWHARLGHPSSTALRQILHRFEFTCNKTDAHSCEACRLGKHVRLPFSSSSSVASFPFELIHSDVWTSPVPSNSGYTYYLVIMDDYSHFVWTFPLRRKSDVAPTLLAFFAYVSTQFGRPIHALQTDNGKEFDNITIRTLLASHGAIFRLTCPYTSQQNGRAERILRTLNDCVRTLLFHAYMPPRFWPDALAMATLLVNIRPCRVRWHYSPHHLLFGVPPAYDDLRVFGCRCYPSTAATAAHKLAPRSLPCVFLGYPANTKGYRCYDPVSHRVFTSRHVYFDEFVFPFQQVPSTTPSAPADPLAAGPARRRLTAVAPSAPAPPGPSAPAVVPPAPSSPATPEAPPAPPSPPAASSAAASPSPTPGTPSPAPGNALAGPGNVLPRERHRLPRERPPSPAPGTPPGTPSPTPATPATSSPAPGTCLPLEHHRLPRERRTSPAPAYAFITEQHIHLAGDRIGHPPACDQPHPRHAADLISRPRAPPRDPVKIVQV